MSTDLTPASATSSLEIYRPRSANELRARVNLIQEVMRSVMKDKVHYGIIPGCEKPSLWKPGSEVLLVTFNIAIEPIVDDLSTADEARFRVTTRATSNGTYLGSGIGEASSAEEKYQWREAVCGEEWLEQDKMGRARTKYKRKRDGGFFTVCQVRTNVADIANTVLKMAKKRSQIDVTLTVTGASDCFSQDIEDLPEELQEAVGNEHGAQPQAAPLPTELKRKSAPAATEQRTQAPQAQHQAAPTQHRPAPPKPPTNGDVISEAQARRFYAIWKAAGRSKDEVESYLQDQIGTSDDRQIPRKMYESICEWAEGQ